MKLKQITLLILSFTTILLLVSGCSSVPFAPIAIPSRTDMKEQVKVDDSNIRKELLKLHNASHEQYKIVANDTFVLVVDGYEKLSRLSVMVLPDGTINVSPIGSVKIAGLTLPEASKVLSEKYKKFVKVSNVILEPILLRNYTFTVSGTVNTPGIYPIAVGATRLSDAVALAGGLLNSTANNENIFLSDLNAAYIARDGKILPVDFTKALLEGDMLNNIPIMNGDFINIPSLENGKITILGEIKSPMCIAFQPNLTLLQAIGFAGGLLETNSRHIKVIRGGLKNPDVFNINIKDMMLGKIMDFQLKPLDIVFIPRDGLSEWNVMIRHILPTFQLINSAAGPFGNPASAWYD